LIRLINTGARSVTFTVTSQSSADRPESYHVPAHSAAVHPVNPLKVSHGWYDVAVKVSSDRSWSRRYVGHLENGSNSITG